jgi:hypothetical protein
MAASSALSESKGGDKYLMDEKQPACLEAQETLALLRILALTDESLDDGNARPVREAFARVRVRARARPSLP